MSLILVVDDEEFIRTLIKEVLDPQGHTVITASSGKEAFQLCHERSFDLLITDLEMPDMDGIELISSLRGVQKKLPILAISGAFSGRFLRMAKALGAVKSLDKPFRMAELLAMVDKILGKQSG
jgi:two-component system, chemotaxis family, chemotaxis protein CheY